MSDERFNPPPGPDTRDAGANCAGATKDSCSPLCTGAGGAAAAGTGAIGFGDAVTGTRFRFGSAFGFPSNTTLGGTLVDNPTSR